MENSQNQQIDILTQIIQKYQRTKFESLSLQDLAIIQTTPQFPQMFKKATGENWVEKYQIKARERLNAANYDTQWFSRKANDQMNALFVNIEKGNFIKVQNFLKLQGTKGKNDVLNCVNTSQKSPLHVACIYGYIDIVKLLVEYGFNINARDKLLKTPLLYACQEGEFETVKFLLSKGANINLLKSGDQSVLHLAASSNSPETVQYLIQKNKNLVSQKDNSLLTPLHYAVYNVTPKQVDIMRILLENGADPNAVDQDGATPLIHASKGGKIKASKMLLMNGSLVDIRENKLKKNALEFAPNDNVRSTLVIYSHKQLGENPDLLENKDKQLLEDTLLVEKPKVKIDDYQPEIFIQSIPKTINKLINNQKSPVSEFFRNKFYTMLKKLQEDGVNNFYHINQPSLFTASWMEDITCLDDLFQMSQMLSGQLMLLRTFNILCPYENSLPIPENSQYLNNDDESNSFYGKSWFQNMSATYHRSQLQQGEQKEIEDLKQKIQDLEDALELQHDENSLLMAKNEQLILEVAEYHRNKDIFDQKLKDQRTTYENLIAKLKQQISEQKLKVSSLESENNDLQIEILNLKDSNANEISAQILDLQSQLQDKEDQIKKLNKEIDKLNSENKKNKKEISDLQNQLLLLQKEQEKIQQQKEEEKERQEDKKMKENLDPERALINMHKNIENIDPYKDITQRMLECDIDKNETLTPLEFMLFCERVKLVQLETKVLQNLANILPEKPGSEESISFAKWKDISENNPKICQIWNQRLFGRILQKLALKKYTDKNFKEVSEKIDIQNDGKIYPKELKNAYHSLKIHISEKDFINSFESLDADGNGFIDNQEFVNILEKFLKEISENQIEPDLKFEKRFLPDFYDYQAPKLENDTFIPQFDGLDPINQEKRVSLNEDVEPINGNLLLQIPFGQNLINQEKLKQVTIRTLLKGSGAAEASLIKSLIMFDFNSWEYCLLIPIRRVLRENVNDHLHIMLFENDEDFLTDKNFLGEVKILWKECIQSPEDWHISSMFKLKNRSFLKEIPKEITGELGVQVQWIPSTSKKFVGKVEQNVDLFQLQPTRQFFQRSIVEKGMLEVVLVSSFLQERNILKINNNNQQQQKIKPQNIKAKIVMPDKSEETFKAKYDAKKQPYWNEKKYIDLKEYDNKKNEAIFIKIFVDNGLLSSDDILGEIYIDWEECLDWVGDYQTRRAYLFKKHNQILIPDKVYVKVRWIPNSIYQQLTKFTEGSEKDKAKSIKNSKENIQQGVLKIIVISAKNLRADDGTTSDPYAILNFINFDDKKLKYETKTKGKTLNPKWNESFNFNIGFYKDGPVPPLQIQVKDKDFSSDDDLGTVDIDLHQVVDNDCDWHFDDIFFDIDDPQYDPSKNPEIPQIQIACYFVPEGKQDPNKKPKNWRDDKTIKGELKVNIVHAREVKIADSKSSDPYAILKFPNGKEYETSVISNSLNPIWNESFSQQVLVSEEKLKSGKSPLQITVKDSDTLATDDVLGYCEIQWNSCVSKPGEWEINQIFELQGAPDIKKNLKTLGFIYIQIKFLEEGMQDDNQKPVCIENLADIISKQQGIYKGNLRIFLVHAKDLVKADDGEKDLSDPFVVFKVPGGKQVKTKEITDSLRPIWKTIYNVPINMPMDSIQPMRLEVVDYDLVGDDLMGYTTIDLLKALKSPGKWEINEIFKLNGDASMKKKYKTEKFGDIYLQIMFVPDGVQNEDAPLPLTEDLTEIDRKKKEEMKTPMNGLLNINVVFARGLKMADKDSSDPYCELTFPDKKTICTKQIDADLNPIWNFKHKYQIKFNKEDYKPIKFTVKDKDAMAIDDTLGIVSVEWMECYDNPSMWQINQLFKLQGESKTGEDLGDIYIQIQYIKLEDIENPEVYTICKTNPDVMEQYGKIFGNLEIKIISGLDLKNADWGGKSDPFVVAYIFDENSKKQQEKKSQLKTNVIENNLNPEWNFEGKFFIDFLRCEIQGKVIRFDLFDDDNLSSEQIGQTSIDLIDCLEKPTIYYEDQYVLVDHEKKDINTNYGSLKLGYKWIMDKDCESTEGLRKPEKMFEGEIFVRVVNCKQLKKKMQSFVYFELTNNLKKKYGTPKRKNAEIDPEYNYEEKIPILIGERKYKSLKAHFTIVEDGFIDSNLGGFTLGLRDIIDKPGQWINSYEKIKGADESKLFGYCYVQIQFRPKNPESPINTEFPQPLDFQALLEQGKPITVPGNLFVRIVGARKIPTSSLDKSDPFVKAICSKGSSKIIQTKTLDDNLTPVWLHEDMIPLDLEEAEYQNIFLNCKLYDYDYASNDLLGLVEIDLSPLFLKPGDYINQIYPLLNEKGFPGAGELYIQIQWRPDSMLKDLKTDLPENLFEKEEKLQKEKEEELAKKKQEEDAIPDIEGILFVKVVQCLNIIKADTFNESDGIVILKVNKGSKQILKTQEIENCANPVFDKEISFEIKAKPDLLKQDFYLTATLEDVDPEGNDFLGFLEYKLDEIYSQPGKWYNQVDQLCDAKGLRGKNGMIYIQIQWRPNSLPDLDKKLPDPVNIEQFIEQQAPQGILLIKVLRAKEILGVEKKGEYSDAFLKLNFNKKNKETKVVKSVNPEWNEVFQYPFKFKYLSEIPFLIGTLYDYNRISDTFLGDFELNITESLNQPNIWSEEKTCVLANLKKQKIDGELTGNCYLQICYCKTQKEADEIAKK